MKSLFDDQGGVDAAIEAATLRSVNWQELAACRDENIPTSLFWPERGDNAALNAAKKVCFACPVRTVCLDEHLWEQTGVFGGTSPRERRAIRRERGLRQSDNPHARRELHLERDAEIRRLARVGWDTQQLARLLGIDRRTIYRVLNSKPGGFK